jgi:hypothetical protein
VRGVCEGVCMYIYMYLCVRMSFAKVITPHLKARQKDLMKALDIILAARKEYHILSTFDTLEAHNMSMASIKYEDSLLRLEMKSFLLERQKTESVPQPSSVEL